MDFAKSEIRGCGFWSLWISLRRLWLLDPENELQILLENAIEHALEQMSEAIYIEIRADFDGQWLVLYVADDGPGMTARSA